jgi:hypothetical protein
VPGLPAAAPAVPGWWQLTCFIPRRMIKFLEEGSRKPASSQRSVYLYIIVAAASLCQSAKAQETVVLGWDPPTNSTVAGYKLYFGSSSGNYTITQDVGTNTVATVSNLSLGSNYFFTVTSYTASGMQSPPANELEVSVPFSEFLVGQQTATNGGYYLQFTNGNFFGYYTVPGNGWIDHADLGYEYLIEANDGKEGIYFYDWASSTYWYTTPSLFPYLFDFTLDTWLYYLPDPNNPGHYTTNPRRFYDYATLQDITK